MRPYLVNDKHLIPGVVIWFFYSVALSIAAFTIASASLSIYGAFAHSPGINLLDLVPKFVSYLFVGWGVYTGVGAVFLWGAAWVYWVALDRSNAGMRIMWFFLLLIGMFYGALFYTFYLWGSERIKRAPSQGAVGRSTMEEQSA
ncbi:MAG: hypothetical protein ACLGSD_10475 [Acidobacteriota bacterium]